MRVFFLISVIVLGLPDKGLLTFVSDSSFNRSWVTRAVVLDISNAFDRVWHAGLLHILVLWSFRLGI